MITGKLWIFYCVFMFTECSDWKYGDCQTNCTCVKLNSDSCNKETGACVCKAGWEGDDCSRDKDECNLLTYSCPAHSTCVNNDGSYSCRCQDGYVKSADGKCTRELAYIDLQTIFYKFITENFIFYHW